jgi:hypothetical protein
MQINPKKTRNRTFRMQDGKLYFTREAERRIFFVLTLLMLAAGVMIRMGMI